MKITTYGEDGLTLWTLANRLEHILTEVGDTTKAAEATVLFRPSFGRRAPDQKRTDSNPRRESQFGEFDAIVGTEQSILALEFKREGCSEYCKHNGEWVIGLRGEQYRRHEVFDWYVQQFSDYIHARVPDPHQAFVAYLQAQRRHPAVRPPGTAPALPPSNSTLARNLEYVLERVVGCHPLRRRRVLHIVVYMYDKTEPHPAPKAIVQQGQETDGARLSGPDEAGLELRVVCLPVSDGSRDGFVDLDVYGFTNGSH